jgi:hypothetical protein
MMRKNCSFKNKKIKKKKNFRRNIARQAGCIKYTNFGKGTRAVRNLIIVVERSIIYLPRTEENYYWKVWSLLFRMLAGGRHHLVNNSKDATYSTLIYDIENGFTNRTADGSDSMQSSETSIIIQIPYWM